MPERRGVPQDILTSPTPQDILTSPTPQDILPRVPASDTRDLHEQDFETWLTTEIPKQYELQSKTLDKLGLLQILPECGEYGIVGIDGNEYPIPTLENIQAEIRDNREKYETKQKQGFVKLQMTPFGLPLERLTSLLEQRLVDHNKRGKLLGTKEYPEEPDEQLHLGPNKPFYISDDWIDPNLPEGQRGADVTGKCVYHETKFGKVYQNGLTKQQILDNQTTINSPFAGWEVKLLEATINIPIEGQEKEINGRWQLGTNQKPVEYLERLYLQPQYHNEQGITNEDWVILFLTHLEQTNQVIDDIQHLGSGCCIVGSFNKSTDVFGYGDYYRGAFQAALSDSDPGDERIVRGTRTAVPIGN